MSKLLSITAACAAVMIAALAITESNNEVIEINL